VIKYLILI